LILYDAVRQQSFQTRRQVLKDFLVDPIDSSLCLAFSQVRRVGYQLRGAREGLLRRGNQTALFAFPALLQLEQRLLFLFERVDRRLVIADRATKVVLPAALPATLQFMKIVKQTD